MVLLTIFSLIPLRGENLGEKGDKVFHFFAYFVTSLLFYLSFRLRLKQTDIFSGLFAFGYGAVIELIQWLLPYREGSLGDLIANFSGVLCFFLLYKVLWGKM